MPRPAIAEAIDWQRMAVPQDDGYDTDVIMSLRQPDRTRGAAGDAVFFCDGVVAARPGRDRGLPNPGVQPTAADNPNIPAAGRLLACWPAACAQFKRLIDTVFVYTDPQQARLGALSLGSSSHSWEQEFGAIHVTIENAPGCAQSLVHEMAHHKLRALGISVETAQQLIINPPSQRFVSPIRKDRTRPMTAVFHAQYSFIHVTALDLHMVEHARDDGERSQCLMLLARNVPRMRAGQEVIARHIETDDAGASFVAAFMAWSETVVQSGQAVLDANGYGAA